MEKRENFYGRKNKASHICPSLLLDSNADKIVEYLMIEADDDPSLALYRLLFYLSRCHKKNINKKQVKKAQEKLKKMLIIH